MTSPQKTPSRITFSPFVCGINGCKFFARNRKVLRNHKQRKHFRPFICDHCDSKFGFKFDLKRHIDFVHLNEHQFLCKICGLLFKYKPSLLSHLAEKHETPEVAYRCTWEDCQKCFHIRHAFQEHMNSHMKYRPYLCNTCDKKFMRKTNLAAHRKRCEATERSFVCEICSCTFKTTSDLNQHKQTHENKILKCKHCCREFRFKSNMYKHQKKCKPK